MLKKRFKLQPCWALVSLSMKLNCSSDLHVLSINGQALLMDLQKVKSHCLDHLTSLARICGISQFFLLQGLVPFIYLTAPFIYQLHTPVCLLCGQIDKLVSCQKGVIWLTWNEQQGDENTLPLSHWISLRLYWNRIRPRESMYWIIMKCLMWISCI